MDEELLAVIAEALRLYEELLEKGKRTRRWGAGERQEWAKKATLMLMEAVPSPPRKVPLLESTPVAWLRWTHAGPMFVQDEPTDDPHREPLYRRGANPL